jgi:hypothetical protein
MLVNMNITILGSCRQYSIKNKYNVTSIQDRLTFPHYTKEIIQAIEYCKGVHQFNNNLSQYCFRTGILNRSDINCQTELQHEFENTDLFIIEIASRISYKWNSVYVHHILSENEYGFHDIPNIKICDLTDIEIENDIVLIKKLLYPKKILIVSHVYTRTSGKRYELVKLLEHLTTKYDIPFINPSELLKNETDIYEEGQAFHYSSKGNDLVEKLYKEYIDRIFNKKTVVLVWKLSYNNYPKTLNDAFWGIGDLIRGAIGLYKLSKKYNFDLIVDKSLHPISHILKNDKHIYSNYIQENNIPLVLPEDVDHYIYTNLRYNNIIYMYSNMPLNSYDGEISDELRHFINYILRPREEFKCIVDELLSKLNTYSIIHYRLGDDELVRSLNGINYENVYSHLLNNYKPDSILITDSTQFKNLVKTRNANIKILDTKICHIGHEQSYDALRDTLLEYFILTKATNIKSFTCYGWISGFVYSVHKIFEIPLEPHTNCIF